MPFEPQQSLRSMEEYDPWEWGSEKARVDGSWFSGELHDGLHGHKNWRHDHVEVGGRDPPDNLTSLYCPFGLLYCFTFKLIWSLSIEDILIYLVIQLTWSWTDANKVSQKAKQCLFGYIGASEIIKKWHGSWLHLLAPSSFVTSIVTRHCATLPPLYFSVYSLFDTHAMPSCEMVPIIHHSTTTSCGTDPRLAHLLRAKTSRRERRAHQTRSATHQAIELIGLDRLNERRGRRVRSMEDGWS